MTTQALIIEIIGWSSTITFLFSIVVPNRQRLHQIGVFTAITTGIYGYMIYKLRNGDEAGQR